MKRTAQEAKALIKERAESRNIVLWGEDDSTKSFYQKYKEQLHIRLCVTEKKGQNDFLDKENQVPIVEWREYTYNAKDYIVVGGGTGFLHMETQLLIEGFHMFEEYVQLIILDAILQDKKIAIMAGNCHLMTMYDCICEMSAFNKEYQAFSFPTHRWKCKWSSKYLSFLKNLCDVYVCSRHEEDDPKYFRQNELPENCKVVVVPSTIIRLYWPQLKANREKAKNEFLILDKAYKRHAPFEFGDPNINWMLKEGKNVEDVIATLTDEDFYTAEQVAEHMAMVERTLEYEEEGCDIGIASYICDNYKKRMLYRDMWHMEIELLWELVRRLMEHLGLDASEVSEKKDDTSIRAYQGYVNHCTEIPVYPSVAKHLGLEWCNKDTLYEVTFYNGTKKLTFEEYVRAYYSLCSKVKQIQEEW